MAKKKGKAAGIAKLTRDQIGRLRKVLERAVVDAAFRRRLLANPRAVLKQHRIGLSAAQLRQFEKAKKAVIKKARELEKKAVDAARKLSKQGWVLGMPQIR